MRTSNTTRLEHKRSREIERVGKKLIKAMEHDTFFFSKVENLSDSKKLHTLFDSFNEMDPTPNHMYIKWLTNNYVKRKFRVEDKARVREVLEDFNRLKPRLKQYGFSPDINQYDFHSLEEMIDKINGGDSIKGDTEYHKRFEELEPDEYEVLYDGPYGILVTPKTKHASCVLGRGTKWCTAAKHDNMFDRYNNEAALYIWRDNTGLYQFWFGKFPQLADSRDRELSYDRIMKMRKKYPPLDEFFRNEEKKIMSNPEHAYGYAMNAIKDRWPEAEPYIMNDPEMAYRYAYEIMDKKRWPEAEPHIMKDPLWAYEYANYVMDKKCWTEAEPYIMKEPRLAYRYTKEFMGKKRWPEAEPYIMKEPEFAYRYARDVIKDRWPEAEPYIMKDPVSAFIYALCFIKDRWPEAEPYIMKDPEPAFIYALCFIEDRWPEAEPYIKISSYWYDKYKSTFLDK